MRVRDFVSLVEKHGKGEGVHINVMKTHLLDYLTKEKHYSYKDIYIHTFN